MESIKILLVLSVVLCVAVGQGSPKEWTPEFIPDLTTEQDKCGLTEPAYVCDPNNLLTDDELLSVNDSIVGIMNDTYCQCGGFCVRTSDNAIIFTVLVIEGVSVDHNRTVLDALNGMATSVRQKWKVGACGNDAVLVVSSSQKTAAISIGAKVTLAQLCFDKINEHYQYLLKNGSLVDAVTKLLEEYRKSISEFTCSVKMYKYDENYTPTDTHGERYKHQELVAIVVGVLLTALFFLTCGIVICVVNRRQQPHYMRSRRSRSDV